MIMPISAIIPADKWNVARDLDAARRILIGARMLTVATARRHAWMMAEMKGNQ
ncbi:hypothetical protein J2W42_003779 [Rhizobium tibeticum]|uniref:hypothetical protein n=1 Tax=Rhizobium tibeticum TaxID=501024 RepID=UPI002784A498|nr:hypothetical protein [Rhizobium tibeticum]MDP9810916.1 hypothetical protein [Rhizobium tibeticum]